MLTDSVYSQVCEEDGWIGTVRLHVLHGVPLVDTELVGCHPALVVADPGQKEAAWVVVMATSHLAGLVERLEGWPEADSEREEDSHIRGCLEGEETNLFRKTEVKFRLYMTVSGFVFHDWLRGKFFKFRDDIKIRETNKEVRGDGERTWKWIYSE